VEGHTPAPVTLSRPQTGAVRVKPDRDRGRAGQRYMRLSRGELVERLLLAEEACWEHQEKWLRTADELFAWMGIVGRLFSTG
jgi:hypothetical protein